jgi:hypothetical protein
MNRKNAFPQLRERAIALRRAGKSDVVGAEKFWLGITGINPTQLRRSVLKRHNPKTTRKNTGDDYHGCLRIDVRRSMDLYRKIEGWATACTTDRAAIREETD